MAGEVTEKRGIGTRGRQGDTNARDTFHHARSDLDQMQSEAGKLCAIQSRALGHSFAQREH